MWTWILMLALNFQWHAKGSHWLIRFHYFDFFSCFQVRWVKHLDDPLPHLERKTIAPVGLGQSYGPQWNRPSKRCMQFTAGSVQHIFGESSRRALNRIVPDKFEEICLKFWQSLRTPRNQPGLSVLFHCFNRFIKIYIDKLNQEGTESRTIGDVHHFSTLFYLPRNAYL